MSRVRLIGSIRIHSGAISLRKDKFSLNGRIIEKEIVEHQNSVGIVPVIDREFVLLVSQYRRAAGKTLLEIPAGKIERGETPIQAAKREMAEEIGYEGKLEPLMKCYLAPGYDTELMHMFVATRLRKTTGRQLDDDEDIVVKKLSLARSIEKCYNGQIQDCKSIAALMAYRRAVQWGEN